MKIILLGGKGMLGQYLFEILRNDHEVFLSDRKDLDITDIQAVKAKFLAIRPEIVVNCTAYNAVDLCEQSEEQEKMALAINGEAVKNLAVAAATTGALVVHYSTDYVFDGQNKNGYQEDAVPAPQNKYGKSKLLGEQYLQNSGVPYYLIRTSKLFGKMGQSANVKKSFVDVMLDLAVKNESLKVIDQEVSCPTYAYDLATQTRYILKNKLPVGIYHGVNNGSCTWYELAKEIFKLKNMKIVLQPVNSAVFPRPAKRPAYSVLLNTKLPPLRSWQEALAEYLKSTS